MSEGQKGYKRQNDEDGNINEGVYERWGAVSESQVETEKLGQAFFTFGKSL